MVTGIELILAEILAGSILAVLGYIANKIRKIEKHTKENKRHIQGEDENPHHNGILQKMKELEGMIETQMERLRDFEQRLRKVEKNNDNEKRTSESD